MTDQPSDDDVLANEPEDIDDMAVNPEDGWFDSATDVEDGDIEDDSDYVSEAGVFTHLDGDLVQHMPQDN
jgi:hypothetical protein